jgi:hypothetical protein
MDFDEIREGNSVKVCRLNELPRKILARGLGIRKLNVVGIVIAQSVPGFDSPAMRVEIREDFGEKTGQIGIYFRGEIECIPDLPPF